MLVTNSQARVLIAACSGLTPDSSRLSTRENASRFRRQPCIRQQMKPKVSLRSSVAFSISKCVCSSLRRSPVDAIPVTSCPSYASPDTLWLTSTFANLNSNLCSRTPSQTVRRVPKSATLRIQLVTILGIPCTGPCRSDFLGCRAGCQALGAA